MKQKSSTCVVRLFVEGGRHHGDVTKPKLRLHGGE